MRHLLCYFEFLMIYFSIFLIFQFCLQWRVKLCKVSDLVLRYFNRIDHRDINLLVGPCQQRIHKVVSLFYFAQLGYWKGSHHCFCGLPSAFHADTLQFQLGVPFEMVIRLVPFALQTWIECLNLFFFWFNFDKIKKELLHKFSIKARKIIQKY